HRPQARARRTVLASDVVPDTRREPRLAATGVNRVVVVGGELGPLEGRGEVHWHEFVGRASERFRIVDTLADDPALLIYTSGTTGPPKGALIPHRALIGNLPGFVASQDWFPQPDDVFWSPADWAWTGGLMDALFPTLYFGRPIVASRSR